MNRSGAPQPRPRGKQNSLGGLLLLIVALVVYSFVQPRLNARFGWNLPGLQQPGEVAEMSEATQPSEAARRSPTVRRDESTPVSAEERSDEASRVIEPPAEEATSPLAVPKASPRPQAPAASPSVGGTPSPAQANQRDARDELRYGLLVDEGGDRYRSPAGLLYTRGSQEGHRLKHLERHVVDDPSRPGSHGVFDGGMEGALATVDLAYKRALAGAKTTKQEEDGRVIYTVDLGKRVGFVGGSDGKRRKHPMARRVRLVLDRDRVITAYPM
jgi:hypothetical protein